MSLLGLSRSPWADRVLSVLRVVIGALFVMHGTQKLFGWPSPMPPGFHLVTFSQIWFAGVLETFGGAAVCIGLLTRPIAFLLSGEMAVAYFQMHFPRGFFPTKNGGEIVVCFCFVFLYLSFAGPGPWSVDAMMSRAKSS